MNFERIILPGFLIADLYKHSLVDLSANSANQQVTEKTPRLNELVAPALSKISFLGENGRNVIIVVNQKSAEHINKADLAFLTNVLKACSLDVADIAIVNIAAQNLTYANLKDELGAMRIILFDVPPSAVKLPFTIPDFQPQVFDGVTFLVAPALSEINKTDAQGRILKTGLWTSLKKIFDIK